MPAPIKITKPAGPGEPPPKLKIEFRGENQRPFFEFRKLALAHFDCDATTMGRLLILDFVKEYKEFPHNNRARRLVQMVLSLDLGGKVAANVASKRARGQEDKK